MQAVMWEPELRNAEQPLRVFVSSVIAGLVQERRAARAAAEALGMDPWVFEEMPASSEALEDSYLMYVTEADFVLWLVGEQTTEPVEREVRLAAASPLPRLLAFVLREREQDEATWALLTELGASMKWSETTAETLEDSVRKTLEDELRRAARAHAGITGEPVPTPVAGFVAREGELALVDAWVAEAEAARPLIVGISGMPGVGKTALALELADRLREQYPDVALYEDLRGVRTDPVPAAQALARMLPALGLPAEHPEPQAAYLRAMRARRGVVILDDARDETQVRGLMPEGSPSIVLITGRTPLAALAGIRLLRLSPLDATQGVAMLASLIGEDRVAGDQAGAERIVELCGGLPLALRITGGRLATRPGWTLAGYADRLRDERRRLEEMQLGDLDVRASFMLSYALLTDEEANALHLAAIVSSGVLDAADVAAAAGFDARGALESLADAQLIVPLEIGRYGMHELMRLFARERWEEDVDEPRRRAALERLAAHYVEEASSKLRAFRAGAGATDALAWFDARRRVVQDVVGELGDGTADDLLIALVFAVLEFFVPLEAYGEMLTVALAGLAASERAGDDDAAIACSVNVAIARQNLGELAEAEVALRATAELAHSRADPINEARALAQLGLLHKNRGQADRAREYLESATERYADSGDQVGAARALGDLANVLDDLGEHAEASSRHRQAIERFRALGDRLGEALEWGNLSISLANEGNFDGAFDACSRADVLWTDLGALRYRARGQEKWGEIALRAGDEATAEEHYEQATAIVAEIGDPTAEARLHWQRSKVRTEVGQFDAGRSDLERASRMFAELGDTAALALVRGAMAYLLETMGDAHAARATYLDAVAAFEAANAHPHAHGAALVGLAGIYIADGDIRAARPALERAVALLDDDHTGFADEVREMLHDVTDALGEEADG